MQEVNDHHPILWVWRLAFTWKADMGKAMDTRAKQYGRRSLPSSLLRSQQAPLCTDYSYKHLQLKRSKWLLSWMCIPVVHLLQEIAHDSEHAANSGPVLPPRLGEWDPVRWIAQIVHD